jgi:hypothetical protein
MVIRYNMGWHCESAHRRTVLRGDGPVANFYIARQREVYPDEWIARASYLPF